MTIQYTEKGIGLHERILRSGHWLAEGPDGWSCSDEQAVQAIIDAYALDDAKALVIAQVKELARQKILAFLPDWKQSNLNARMNELNEVRFSRALTDGEAAEIEAMRSAWSVAKAIRAASNVHEQTIAALDDFAPVLAYDIHAGWPGA